MCGIFDVVCCVCCVMQRCKGKGRRMGDICMPGMGNGGSCPGTRVNEVVFLLFCTDSNFLCVYILYICVSMYVWKYVHVCNRRVDVAISHSHIILYCLPLNSFRLYTNMKDIHPSVLISSKHCPVLITLALVH
jgi:hypothetical protein